MVLVIGFPGAHTLPSKDMRANHLISRTPAPDFTTESTEITETDWKKGFGLGSGTLSFRPLWPLCALW